MIINTVLPLNHIEINWVGSWRRTLCSSFSLSRQQNKYKKNKTIQKSMAEKEMDREKNTICQSLCNIAYGNCRPEFQWTNFLTSTTSFPLRTHALNHAPTIHGEIHTNWRKSFALALTLGVYITFCRISTMFRTAQYRYTRVWEICFSYICSIILNVHIVFMVIVGHNLVVPWNWQFCFILQWWNLFLLKT